MIPVSSSNFRFELRFNHLLTIVGDVRVVSFCCIILIMLCILQSKSICVVAICGDSKFVQYGQLKCDWNRVFALMDKVNCRRFFCVKV